MAFLLFEILIAAHIATGATGAVAFWVPILGRKGGRAHAKWGRVFAFSLVATGCLAMAMSALTLVAPLETHPHLVGRFDAAFIRGIFGWMMLAAGLLTVNLAWYGWLAIRNKGRHAANRTRLNMFLQIALIPVSLACVWQSWTLANPLIAGIATPLVLDTGAADVFVVAAADGVPGWCVDRL
jgi:hypothetical protein